MGGQGVLRITSARCSAARGNEDQNHQQSHPQPNPTPSRYVSETATTPTRFTGCHRGRTETNGDRVGTGSHVVRQCRRRKVNGGKAEHLFVTRWPRRQETG